MGIPSRCQVNMYALYSKSFAKGATDLNKNDFHAGHNFKVSSKGSASSGASFEVAASDKPNDKANNALDDASITVKIPVDKAFSVSLKTTAGKDTEVTTEMKATDAATLSLVAKNFDVAAKDLVLTGSVNYVDPAFSMEGKFGLFDGPKCYKDDATKFNYGTGTLGASGAFAFECPFAEGVSVGLQPAIGFGKDKSALFNMPFAIGGGGKDFQLAFTGGFVLDGGKPTPSSGGIKGLYDVSSDLKVGFEVEHMYYNVDAKAVYKEAAKKDSFDVKIGAEYKVSDKTTIKGKGTFKDGKITFDSVFKTALDGKKTLAVGTKFSEGKPSVGLTFNLE